jgi:putative DNA primase/helicase
MTAESLYDAMANAGYVAPEQVVWDGKLHRFATDHAKRHSKDGWYIAHDDARGKAAAFGSWRDGGNHVWSNGTGRKLTDAEFKDIEAQKKKALAEERKAREQSALRAQRIFEQASETVEYSAYLERKGITCPDGVRAVQGLSSKAFGFDGDEFSCSGLIVPMRNKSGEIRSLQLIPEDAGKKKLFMKGGQVAACFHVLGEIGGSTMILIAEGLATAQSARAALGCTALVAFSAGNLPDVAEIARSLNATADIVICADDDEAGRKKAAEAAKRAGARIVIPGSGCNDFNDLHQAQGLAAVKLAILGPEPEPEDADDWKADLIVKHKDNGDQIIPCRVHNLIVILQNAPEFKGRIRYNRFSESSDIDDGDADEVVPIRLMASLEKNWIKEQVKFEYVTKAVSAVAKDNEYHPVLDYLHSLTWDGIPRIDNFFSDHFGTPHDPYHVGVARSLFISAVLRVVRPGCKCDTMTILQGCQGAGKTEIWIALFGKWHAEVIDSLNGKDFFSGQRGIWCADFGELDQFSKTETTRIKQILTMREDNYRNHYGRVHVKHPRQLIFVGGTNSHEWLNDPTGGRRFLPVKVDRIDVEAVATIRDQLWAEALIIARNPGRWWEIEGATDAQEESYAGDSWEELIADHLVGKENITIARLLYDGLKIEYGKQTKPDQTRAGNALRRLGWTAKQEMLNGARVRVYRRKKSMA